MTRTSEGLLTPETVGDYLARRGLSSEVAPEALGGGVSNVVLAVGDLVVKQALARLNVADEWFAKRERTLTEAAAIDLCGRLEPGSAPPLVDVDPDACVLVVRRAPDDSTDWKSRLLAGDVAPDVAAALGRVLAGWHARTVDDGEVADRFDDAEAFEHLRIDPYHRTVMERLPELATDVGRHVERMEATRRCLVHGDYSPKNVLVGPGLCWVIDFEVAHFGDPAFDLAFMLNHLMLKTIHRPSDAEAYRAAGLAFWDAYTAGVPDALDPDPTYVLGHLGCLMVARVDGKSPAEYLTESERDGARSVGARLVGAPPASLGDAWELIR